MTTNQAQYFIPTLDLVADRITTWRAGKGFETPERFDDTQAVLAKLALIGGEIGEAVSAVQKGDFDNYVEELADTIIRILDLAGAQRLCLADAIAIKMGKNEGRPYKHGKLA